MIQTAQRIEGHQSKPPVPRPAGRLSSLSFLLRYPIFLLAFGPPQFKGPGDSTDSSQAHVGVSSAIAVGWLLLISSRAIYRLAFSHSLHMTKQVRAIVKYALILGILFVISVAYSSGRAVSAEMCVLYFLNFCCLIEFLSDAYLAPPDWLQCIFEIRFISITLLFIVFICIPIHPTFVLNSSDNGLRLMGGAVGPLGAICPIIAIISAYAFLHSLESRTASVLNFLVAAVSLAGSQIRGAEISLFSVLAVLAVGWARTNKRGAKLFAAGLIAMILLVIVAATAGGDRIWTAFKRGQDTSELLSGSGRALYAEDVIRYSLNNPQGMGYISGIRSKHFGRFAGDLHTDLNALGGTDDSYMQTLTDAGWASLAIYLIYLSKIVAFGRRFARKKLLGNDPTNTSTQHALRCALLVFMYFLIEAIESSNYVLPLRQEFYYQTAVIGIILGASTSLLLASRPRVSLGSSLKATVGKSGVDPFLRQPSTLRAGQARRF